MGTDRFQDQVHFLSGLRGVQRRHPALRQGRPGDLGVLYFFF